MKRITLVGAILIACIAGAPRHSAAQQRSSLSVETTIGPVYGYTAAEYLTDRRATALDLVLAVRTRAAGRGAIVLAANAGLHAEGVRSLVCVPASDGDGCIQPFPFAHVGGALVGWEKNAGATLRLMGGPAWAHAESDALAWQARFDGAVPLVGRLALVGSLRGTFVPNYRGDAVSLVGVGVGIRIR